MALKANEIVLPVTEPETEWISGRAVRKMSLRRAHGRLQMRIAKALDDWADERGQVATEWRFRPAPPGEAHRPLVPDVAYVRNERLRGLTGDALELPMFSPDVAVEVLSPRDEPDDVAQKISVFLSSGSSLVIIVEPAERTVTLHDRAGTRTLGTGAVLVHEALPGFALALDVLFAAIDPPR
jgi:Uma2 family endonuclease